MVSDTITIALRHNADSQGANSVAINALVLDAGGVDPTTNEGYVKSLVDWFNKNFELYGRHVKLVDTWAIKQGYAWYCSSSLGYDPKLHLGCELFPLDLYVMHTSRPLNFLLRRLLPLLEPTHGDKTLRRFRNYDALWEDA